ncbi:MAG: hypothetical protein AABY01_02990 [Nanoarchaeota archaeon]
MQHVLDALRAIDEQVHRTADAHQALVTATAKLRDYDPVLVNVVRSLKAIPPLSERAYREHLFGRIQKGRSAVSLAWANAAENIAAKLPRNSTIGVLGGNLIALALTKSKKTIVNVFDNSLFAKELSKQHVSVVKYSAPAAATLVATSDALLLPSIAIDDSRVISFPGALTLAQLAQGHIPVYFVAIALQYEPNAFRAFTPSKFANRGQHVQEYVTQHDFIPANLIDGIITELGIFSHKRFIEETKAHYPWIY